jgi:hypothetical protein
MKAADQYYNQCEEPAKGCLLALRDIILKADPDISAAWKYGMPFFCYKGKMFCYLWVHKKNGWPYLGLVEGNRLAHPELVQEKRARMKILLLDPQKDLPLQTIHTLLQQAIDLYKKGIIKIKA